MTMFSPSATGTTMSSTIPRSRPEVVTFRYQNEMAYVPLASSHEEAQEIAVRSLPALAAIDPSLLFFTITIRYKATNERREIAISPKAWDYVTGKLVPYRLIDVKVNAPPVPPAKQPLYTPSPPAQSQAHYTPPPSPVPPAEEDNEEDNYTMPPPPEKSPYTPPYPDTPPPQYPGSPLRKQPVPLPPPDTGGGYGYGFGWHDQVRGHHPPVTAHRHLHRSRKHHDGFDPDEKADRRSVGWSASSVKLNPGSSSHDHGHSGAGGSVFARWRQNCFGIFPITWDEGGRREHQRHRWRRERGLEMLRGDDDHENEYGSSGGGRSYVPSLL